MHLYSVLRSNPKIRPQNLSVPGEDLGNNLRSRGGRLAKQSFHPSALPRFPIQPYCNRVYSHAHRVILNICFSMHVIPFTQLHGLSNVSTRFPSWLALPRESPILPIYVKSLCTYRLSGFLPTQLKVRPRRPHSGRDSLVSGQSQQLSAPLCVTPRSEHAYINHMIREFVGYTSQNVVVFRS
jgi:hypothetical protein